MGDAMVDTGRSVVSVLEAGRWQQTKSCVVRSRNWPLVRAQGGTLASKYNEAVMRPKGTKLWKV